MEPTGRDSRSPRGDRSGPGSPIGWKHSLHMRNVPVARVALLCSKLHLRILRPRGTALIDSSDPVPRPLRKALTSLEDQIHKLCDRARLQPVA